MKKTAEYEYRVLSALSLNFHEGHVRLCNGRIAALQAMLAMRKAHGPGVPAKDGHALWGIVDHLTEVQYREYDSFAYLSEISYLVYGTTLFDCFMSEIARFLFLRNPAALGEEYVVKVDTVLRARSKWDVLNLAVEKQVRNLSYKTFGQRLKVLRERFGLKVSVPRDVEVAIEHYSSRRNAMVHDQAFLTVGLNGRGKLVVKRTKCPRHPTPVAGVDLAKALDAYTSMVGLITEAVAEQVLGVKKGSAKMLKLRKGLARDPGESKQKESTEQRAVAPDAEQVRCERSEVK